MNIKAIKPIAIAGGSLAVLTVISIIAKKYLSEWYHERLTVKYDPFDLEEK